MSGRHVRPAQARRILDDVTRVRIRRRLAEFVAESRGDRTSAGERPSVPAEPSGSSSPPPEDRLIRAIVVRQPRRWE